MSAIVPSAHPMLPRRSAEALLARVGAVAAVCLLGVRGYYRSTMGATGRNDRGIYDDALFLVAPNAYASFNANTDPSVARKHVAVLKAGVWKYKVGTHGLSKPAGQRYTALVQADEVTVLRDQEGADTGYCGINIHRGGYNTTSSLGCQTIHPDQWPAFIALVRDQLVRNAQKVVPYVLVENDGGIA